ncbi:NPC intracellular cholesterol transporter 2 homolog a-like [Ischnura elegans]|uniref:NPC intracellular cholesterol transporter 2 homolog a-like n=1 Tax=Ischnura elegans TaxID=197161 RepID=UPI001ED895D6|nr:NPC intracellular cholesterol transporter 2 homolog a-like [Ischnura elegans]
MDKVLAALSLILCFWCASAETEFKDCGSSGEVLRLKVLDCYHPPCYFQQKTNVTALLHFRTSEDAEVIHNLTSSFVAVLTPELEFPFPYNRTDVCSRLQNAPDEESKYSTAKQCPIGPGTEVIYNTVLPLEDEYPKIRATIRWSITDQSNNTIACVEVLCELL